MNINVDIKKCFYEFDANTMRPQMLEKMRQHQNMFVVRKTSKKRGCAKKRLHKTNAAFLRYQTHIICQKDSADGLL